MSLKEVCQFCYRAYDQIAAGTVKSGWFLSHKGRGSMFLDVHCLFMFLITENMQISLFIKNLETVNTN